MLPNNSHVVTYTRRCVRALSKKDEENAAADPNDTIQASPIPRVLRQMFERLNETILDGVMMHSRINFQCTSCLKIRKSTVPLIPAKDLDHSGPPNILVSYLFSVDFKKNI